MEEDLVAKAENEFFHIIEQEKRKLEREETAKEEENSQEKQDDRKVGDPNNRMIEG